MTDRLAAYNEECEAEELKLKPGQDRKPLVDEVDGMRSALGTAAGRKMFASILHKLYYGRAVAAATPDTAFAAAAVQEQGVALAKALKDADPEMFWLMLKDNDNA